MEQRNDERKQSETSANCVAIPPLSDWLVCPDCGGVADLDYTPEFNAGLPWEVICYHCGYFSADRYATAKQAIAAN